MQQCKQCFEVKPFELFYKSAKYKSGYMGTCKSCKQAYLRKWALANQDKQEQYRKISYIRGFVKKAAYYKKYIEENREKYLTWKAANESLRRARKNNATPKWLTSIHLQEIREFFTIAKDLQWLSNETLEVDHIVPLKGKEVCGLHVPWNMQILTESENRRKYNNYE